MNDMLTLAVIISGMALLLIVFIGVLIYVCTYHAGIYKSLKKPVKAMGIINETRMVHIPHGGENYYVITYSYTDNNGTRRTNSFKWQQNIGGAGDKIAVHYDSQSPQNSITDCQLKYGKNLWWKIMLILAALIIPAVFAAVYFGR